jgi:hypothetical protein
MCLRAKLVFPSLNVWFASRMDFARALTLWLAVFMPIDLSLCSALQAPALWLAYALYRSPSPEKKERQCCDRY